MELINLLEDIVGQFNSKINIVYQVDFTKHAKDQQVRHVSETGKFIPTKEIVDTINNGIKKIITKLIINKIDIGDYILITDKSNDLNIVGVLKPVGEMIDFVVVTVMYKKDFKPQKNTKLITLN